VHSGVLLGVAGIAVSWLALTPWLSIVGLVIASIGGFIALGARQDPETMAQFGRERTLAFLLSFLGVAVLAGERGALGLERAFVLAAQTQPQVFDIIGGTLLLFGLFLHLQPFPFLGWLCRPAKVSSGASVLVAQLFPALAAFGLAIRFESELKTIGIFPYFEVFAMLSAMLTAFCGLSQEGWQTALPLWISSVLSVAFGALCFSGGASAASILFGVIFSALSLVLLACSKSSDTLRSGNRTWFNILSVIAIGPGLGFVGFVSSGGFIRMMSMAGQDSARAVLYAVVLLPTYILLWKNFFSIRSIQDEDSGDSTSSTLPLVSIGVLLVCSLGLIWSGTLTDGLILHDADRLFPSWLSSLFGASSAELSDESGFALGQSVLWSTLVLGSVISFWLFGRGQDLAVRGLSTHPKVRKFLQTGYSIDRAGESFFTLLKKIGNAVETWVSEVVSNEWIPSVMVKALTVPARGINEADQKLYRAGEKTLKQWIELPAKVLQLIQSGDLQWYLFFAIGCAVAILVHFLRA
jgi:hypothetical protein